MSNFRDPQDDRDLDRDPAEQTNRTDPVADADDAETPPDREESIELDAPEYDEA